MSAQEQVLGAVLVDPRHAATVLDRLTLDDFDPGWQQMVFASFDRLYDAGTSCTPESVLDDVIGQLSRNDSRFGVWLAELYEAAPIVPPVELVVEETYRRQIQSATIRIQQAVSEWTLPALLSTVDRELTGAMQAAARLTQQQPKPNRPIGLSGLTELLNGSTAA